MCESIGEKAAAIRNTIILLFYIVVMIIVLIIINVGISSNRDCDLPDKCDFYGVSDTLYNIYIDNEYKCYINLNYTPTNDTDCYLKYADDGYCTLSRNCENVQYFLIKCMLNIFFIGISVCILGYGFYRLYTEWKLIYDQTEILKGHDEEQGQELLASYDQ